MANAAVLGLFSFFFLRKNIAVVPRKMNFTIIHKRQYKTKERRHKHDIHRMPLIGD